MKKIILVFLMTCLGVGTSAHANWQYPGRYDRDCWGGDDGMRFVMSVRGGAAYGKANIVNNIGGLTGQYMMDTSTGEIVTQAWYNASGQPDGYVSVGDGRLGDLGAVSNFSDVSAAVGFSVGFTMPDTPQWRIEFGMDHISEADYNQNPLFQGDLLLTSGYLVEAQSGGVQSTLTSDIYGIMAFYDFFDGIRKPLQTTIPYIGFGVGYADSKTVLQLTDSYGDLSGLYELQDFGIVEDVGNIQIIEFNKATTRTSNLAPMAAVGLSYGVTEKMFLDFGLRAMYLPRIKWQLTNAASGDEEKRRDWFSAEKMIYVNAMVGLRVEF